MTARQIKKARIVKGGKAALKIKHRLEIEWAKIELGDTVFVDKEDYARARTGAWNYSKKLKRKFHTLVDGDKVVIWREW